MCLSQFSNLGFEILKCQLSSAQLIDFAQMLQNYHLVVKKTGQSENKNKKHKKLGIRNGNIKSTKKIEESAHCTTCGKNDVAVGKEKQVKLMTRQHGKCKPYGFKYLSSHGIRISHF